MKVFSPSVTTVLSLTQVCSKTGEQWATIKTFASPWFKSWSQNLGILLTITINCFLFWCVICTSSGNYSHFHIEHLYFFKSRILLGYTKFFVHKESGYLNALKKSGWYLHWHPSKFILSPHTKSAYFYPSYSLNDGLTMSIVYMFMGLSFPGGGLARRWSIVVGCFDIFCLIIFLFDILLILRASKIYHTAGQRRRTWWNKT